MMDESNPINPIIQVRGHHRSGSNYLCALLYKNFYDGIRSIATEVPLLGRRFWLFGTEVTDDPFILPYGRLFGGHIPEAVTQDSIWIVRNREDVEKSIAKMKHPILTDDHIFTNYKALIRRPYIVYYEDLKSYPERVLREIQYHFCLNRLYKVPVVEVGFCGYKE